MIKITEPMRFFLEFISNTGIGKLNHYFCFLMIMQGIDIKTLSEKELDIKKRGASNTLRKAVCDKILESFPNPCWIGEGKAERIYSPGIRFPYNRNRIKKTNNSSKLSHDIVCTDIIFQAVLSCLKSGCGYRYFSEYALENNTLSESFGNDFKTIIPDAVILHEKTALFIEADMDTMLLKELEIKTENYAEYYHSNNFAKFNKTFNANYTGFRLCFVFNNPKRINKFKRYMLDEKEYLEQKWVLLCSYEELNSRDFLNDNFWQTLEHGDKTISIQDSLCGA
ncbi:MAG: replication-relaxation family protein [bacterium]